MIDLDDSSHRSEARGVVRPADSSFNTQEPLRSDGPSTAGGKKNAEAGSHSEVRAEKETELSNWRKTVIAYLSNAEANVAATHLLIDGIEAVSLFDVVQRIQEARKLFQRNESNKSLDEVTSAIADYRQHCQSWRQRIDNKIRQMEEEARRTKVQTTQRKERSALGKRVAAGTKGKESVSIKDLNKLKAERNRVSSQLDRPERLLLRLRNTIADFRRLTQQDG
jgi:hypothetical protein